MYGLASAFRKAGRLSEEVVVEAITFDEFLKPYDAVKLIKIDVEGAEWHVLKGAKEVLNRTSYVIVARTWVCGKEIVFCDLRTSLWELLH